MKKSLRHLSLLLAVLFCCVMLGCESYPLDMSKDQWESLSPTEQAAAQVEQDRLDAERRRLAAERRAERERIAAEREAERLRLEAEQQAAYEAMINERYAHAHFGDIVHVNIHDGQFMFRGKHYAYEPVTFNIIRSESRELIIHRADRPSDTIAVIVRLSDDGHTLYFDDGSQRPVAIKNTGWDKLQTHHVHEHPNRNAHPREIHISIRYRRMNEPARQ